MGSLQGSARLPLWPALRPASELEIVQSGAPLSTSQATENARMFKLNPIQRLQGGEGVTRTGEREIRSQTPTPDPSGAEWLAIAP